MFINSISLVEIQFPYGLETIGSNCFQKCTKLRIVTLPPTLESIGSGAFSGCTSLRTVNYCGSRAITDSDVFPDSLKSVNVSPIYSADKLCGKPAITELLFNCEYLHKPTCIIGRKSAIRGKYGAFAVISLSET